MYVQIFNLLQELSHGRKRPPVVLRYGTANFSCLARQIAYGQVPHNNTSKITRLIGIRAYGFLRMRYRVLICGVPEPEVDRCGEI